MIHYHFFKKLFAVGAFAALLGLASCSSSTTTTPPVTNTDTSKYIQTNLVSDVTGYGALRTDPTLVNAWGISIGTTGTFWLSSNHGSVTDIYDSLGNQKLAPINIPSRDSIAGGAPSGVVFNGTADFNGFKFIYCSEDGIISAWDGKTTINKVALSSSATAVYKGMAIATDAGNQYLYVANFHDQKIDVYDKTFQQSNTFSFTDNASPAIPSDYGPFNIANIGGNLYVTYAKRKAPDFGDDQSGAGNGFVDVFTPHGVFLSRFASNGALNSPWAVMQAPPTFGQFSNMILVGNFGDGKINAFDATGKSLGALNDANGNAISIDGLWGLYYSSVTEAHRAGALYFTAGQGSENHGLFGYIKVK
jgi:uncharacterized protein (TIGR03118 family)